MKDLVDAALARICTAFFGLPEADVTKRTMRTGGWQARSGEANAGQPSCPGHFGAPPLDWTKQFTGDIKTATFKKRGGEIYVSFEKRDGIWYVISNAWLPEGAAF